MAARSVERGFERSELGLHALHFGVVGCECRPQLGNLTSKLRELGLIVAQSQVVQHVRKGLGRAGRCHFVAGLFADPLGLGYGEISLELLELFLGDIGFLRCKNQAGSARISLQAVFAALELDPHPIELACEPLRGVLGSFPSRFQVLLDEFGC